MPILWPRSRLSARSEQLLRSTPSTVMVPARIAAPRGSKRFADRAVMLFPDPDSPTSASTSPSATSRLTSSRTGAASPKPTVRFSISRMVDMVGLSSLSVRGKAVVTLGTEEVLVRGVGTQLMTEGVQPDAHVPVQLREQTVQVPGGEQLEHPLVLQQIVGPPGETADQQVQAQPGLPGQGVVHALQTWAAGSLDDELVELQVGRDDRGPVVSLHAQRHLPHRLLQRCDRGGR